MGDSSMPDFPSGGLDLVQYLNLDGIMLQNKVGGVLLCFVLIYCMSVLPTLARTTVFQLHHMTKPQLFGWSRCGHALVHIHTVAATTAVIVLFASE